MLTVTTQTERDVDTTHALSGTVRWKFMAFIHGVCTNGSLSFALHFVTQLNDSRLYYLWLKYLFLAGIDEQWPAFAKSIPALAQLQTIGEIGSYALYGLRIGLNLKLLLSEKKSAPNMPWALMGDFLWGISNGLSVAVLSSAVIRPGSYTLGWWGNLSMQLLLVYDVGAEFAQYIQRQRLLNRIIIPEHMEQARLKKIREYEQHSCRARIVYNFILAVGYCLFRDFWTSNLPPSSGALMCVIATILVNSFEWWMYALKNSDAFSTPLCMGSVFAVAIDFLFPVFLWFALDKEAVFPSVVIGLAVRTMMHSYLKYEHLTCQKKTPRNSSLLKYSIFKSTPTQTEENTACSNLNSP